MNNRQKILSTAVIMACGAITNQALAALPTNAILQFNAGAKTCILGGTAPSNCDFGVTTTTGSYFSMDSDGNGSVIDSERTAISVNAGLAIGSNQPASGSHSGAANGTESPGIDNPWEFFGNTGMHQTTSNVDILTNGDTGTVTLDFSGWNVTWNGIASIPMGGDTANFTEDNGIAELTCEATCAAGETFTLEYGINNVADGGATGSAHVPLGDDSGFGGVAYTVRLEGTIVVPPAAIPGEGTLDGGSIAGTGSDGRISMDDVVANGGTTDTGYSYNGGLYDFVVTGVATGANVAVQITLTAPIPANAVYRKYSNNSWITFADDANNWIASAAKINSNCPAVNDAAYVNGNGLTEGDECIQITIQEGGTYDDDAVTTSITDPGGIAAADQEQIDTRVSSTNGCSMSGQSVNANQRADWWLVAGFMGLLGLFRHKHNQA